MHLFHNKSVFYKTCIHKTPWKLLNQKFIQRSALLQQNQFAGSAYVGVSCAWSLPGIILYLRPIITLLQYLFIVLAV